VREGGGERTFEGHRVLYVGVGLAVLQSGARVGQGVLGREEGKEGGREGREGEARK